MSEHSTPLARPDQDGVRYRPVSGFPGYCVGDDGSLWSRFPRNGRGPWKEWRRLKPGNCRGYHLYSLQRGGKQSSRLVHRLVLEAFVGNRPHEAECCHADGDRGNNHLSNLRWDTPLANHGDAMRHGTHPRGATHGCARITEEQARLIIEQLDAGHPATRVAADLVVGLHVVYGIRQGKTWRHLPRGGNYERYYSGENWRKTRLSPEQRDLAAAGMTVIVRTPEEALAAVRAAGRELT